MVADMGEIVPKYSEVEMNDFSTDEPLLYAHVSDPPKVLQDGVKSVEKDSLTHGNFKEHLFKHESDPPEVSNDCVKIAAKDVSILRKLVSFIDKTFKMHS